MFNWSFDRRDEKLTVQWVRTSFLVYHIIRGDLLPVQSSSRIFWRDPAAGTDQRLGPRALRVEDSQPKRRGLSLLEKEVDIIRYGTSKSH